MKEILAAALAAASTIVPVADLSSFEAAATSQPAPPPPPEPTTPATREPVAIPARPTPYIADQGDMIVGTWPDSGGGYGQCTAGYVNKAEREVWTSAHCFELGEEITVDGFPIGTVTREGPYQNTADRSHDWAVITLYPNSPLGVNPYSGDLIDRNPEVADGIRRYGAASGISPFSAINLTYNNHMAYCPINSLGGDSGGPIWTTSGLVGIHSGKESDPSCMGGPSGVATAVRAVQ